jgi:hypothetical protein
MPARLSFEAGHAFADAIVATVAGGLALLVFYPLTLCAAGIKSAVRMVRPRVNPNHRRHSITQI